MKEKCRLTVGDTNESGVGNTIAEMINAYLITYYRVECDALLSSGYVLTSLLLFVMVVGLFILAYTYFRTR